MAEITSPAPLQNSFPATDMAPEYSVSPAKQSARRALQNLSPNPKSTPRKGMDFASKSTPKTSPLKTFRAISPTILRLEGSHERSPTNNSRKRCFGDVVSSGQDASSPERSSKEARFERPESQLSTLVIPPITILPLSEKLDASSVEQSSNSSQLPGNIHDQKIEDSFSSLVDYDPSNGSENSSASVLPKSTRQAATVKLRVETLRLRLQMAMFRINTHQMNLPLSKLQLPSIAEGVQPSLSLAVSQPPESPLSLPPSDSGSATDEDPVSPVDSEVASPTKLLPTSKSLKLLPAPLLQPTEYSSRKISAPFIASSPPDFSPREKSVVSKHSTPVRDEMERGLATVASSPDRSKLGGEDLTSSVVKGHAASGLLELKRRV